uniref:Uncharacterized protein n=1 Tax=viral metagenome TaxID=1070528 RepID=A0A6C0LXR4_9ZZZZ
MDAIAYKIVFVGDTNMGKTTYSNAICDTSVERTYPTLGVDVHMCVIEGVSFAIWDCAGDERFGGLREGYWNQAHGAIVFATSASRADEWIVHLQSVCPGIPVVVINPHADVRDGEIYSPYTRDAFETLVRMIVSNDVVQH